MLIIIIKIRRLIVQQKVGFVIDYVSLFVMRFAITSIFCIQLLFLGLQALTVNLQFTPQPIPYYVVLTQTDVIQRQNEDLQHFRQWGDPDGNSYERLEAMRQEQLQQIAATRDIHPGIKSDISEDKSLAPPPTSLDQVIELFKLCHLYFSPQVGVLWFRTELSVPTWLRLIYWIPPLLIPIFILAKLSQIIFTPRNEFEKFLYLQNSNPKKAYALWKLQGIESQFKLQKRKWKRNWLTTLIKLEHMEDALNWGTYLLNDAREDVKFRRFFCEKILIPLNIVDLKYAWIMKWYLQITKNSTLAEELWTKALKNQKIEKLEPEVYEMVKEIEQIIPGDEITKFANHHKLILQGPDGDSSLSTNT